MPKIENKERVLFWLRHRERVVSGQIDDCEPSADLPSSLSERRRIAVQTEGVGLTLYVRRAEAEALRAAIVFIEENSDG